MEMYDFVFVVLVYRNTNDLREFFDNLNIENSKIIVVNAYYDDQSKHEFEEISNVHQADFINIENKGYGYGNNKGIDHAIKNYKFKYLVISNPDVCIKHLHIKQLKDTHITAPAIVTLNGKHQNPYLPYHWQWYENLKYWLYCHNYKLFFILIALISRGTREIYNITKKKGFIYSAHGSFVIIPYIIIIQLHPIYDENIFLYKEEECLAHLARARNIPIFYSPDIQIIHKEDGSTSMMTEKKYDLERQSYITFYKKWHKKNN